MSIWTFEVQSLRPSRKSVPVAVRPHGPKSLKYRYGNYTLKWNIWELLSKCASRLKFLQKPLCKHLLYRQIILWRSQNTMRWAKDHKNITQSIVVRIFCNYFCQDGTTLLKITTRMNLLFWNYCRHQTYSGSGIMIPEKVWKFSDVIAG